MRISRGLELDIMSKLTFEAGRHEDYDIVQWVQPCS